MWHLVDDGEILDAKLGARGQDAVSVMPKPTHNNKKTRNRNVWGWGQREKEMRGREEGRRGRGRESLRRFRLMDR